MNTQKSIASGLDRFVPRPAIALHHQIKEDLFLHLRAGRWAPGFELPPKRSSAFTMG